MRRTPYLAAAAAALLAGLMLAGCEALQKPTADPTDEPDRTTGEQLAEEGAATAERVSAFLPWPFNAIAAAAAAGLAGVGAHLRERRKTVRVVQSIQRVGQKAGDVMTIDLEKLGDEQAELGVRRDVRRILGKQ